MDYKIIFDSMPDYVLVQTEGKATTAGFESLIKELTSCPEWIPGTDQILDHRRLDVDEFTSHQLNTVKDIVKSNGKELGNGRVAFVVGSALAHGFSRMYGLAGGEETHGGVGIFRTIEDAASWLKE